jgi:membrane protease YdiL (CAAX protease family)
MELNEIFINRVGRLRSGWRSAVFAVALISAISFLFLLARVLLFNVLGLPEASLATNNWGWVVQACILLGAATLVGWLCGRWFEDLPLRALGWGLHAGWLRDFLKGSLIGATSLLLAALIATIFGGFRFKINSAATFALISKTILLSGLIFILAAAAEEAMFRGYPLQTMTRSKLAWLALALTAVIFSLGHTSNPNAVRGFTFVNTALAGVWLGLAYLRTRSLWFPLGVHWAWNWMMGALLGLPVSGIEQLTPHPLLRADAIGPAWLTGGAYGIEGGAACTIALLVSTLFIWRTKFLYATEEMLRLTNQEIPKWEQTPAPINALSIDNPALPQNPRQD